MSLHSYQNTHPQIHPSVYIAPGAQIIGDVQIAADSSVWFNTVIRGDVNEIRIGSRTNIQDLSLIHVTHNGSGTYLEDDVTVGHSVTLHACHIRQRCLIGMGAVILDDVNVAEECIVAAGALLPPGKHYPPRSLIIGSPAVVKRSLSKEEIASLTYSAEHYSRLRQNYLP